MTTKRCKKCGLIKSGTEFNKNQQTRDRLSYLCRRCLHFYRAELHQRGLQILLELAISQGCCQHCERPYSIEDRHFFEFDHIDAKLKQSKRETATAWVGANKNQFLKRIALNLQLLCIKCHKMKTKEECELGGSIYQKMHGQSQPAQVIQRDLTLFDAITIESHEMYTLHTQEGEWVTVRDIDGNLIRYEPHSNYIKH